MADMHPIGPESAALSSSRLALFSFPSFTINIFVISLYSFLPPLYAGDIGLGLTVTGAIFMALRVWDLVIDPLVGGIVDRSPTRFGRRKPWILLSAPLLTGSVAYVYFPQPSAGPVYLATGLLVLFTSYALFFVPYQAWSAELSADYNGRSRVMAWMQATTQLGIAAALIGATIAGRQGASLDGQVAVIGWMVIILFPISCVLLALLFREAEHPLRASGARGWDGIRALGLNRPFRQVLGGSLALGFIGGLIIPLLFFFVDQALDLKSWSSFTLLIMVLASLPSLPAFVRLSSRIGKHHTMVGVCLAGTVASVWMGLLPQGRILPLLIAATAFGACYGGGLFLTRTLLADVVDYDVRLSGSDRAGLIFAIQLSVEKIGPALGVFTGYATLDLLGFDPAAAVNNESALMGLRWMVGGGGAVLFALAALAMVRYPLTEALQRARRAERMAAEGEGH
jgi:Na+/melibiose symporter-like transporter